MRSEVEMIYYEDDISSHEQFVELLFKLRKLTKYITIVQIDGEKKNGCKCYYMNVQKVENKNVHSKDMC